MLGRRDECIWIGVKAECGSCGWWYSLKWIELERAWDGVAYCVVSVDSNPRGTMRERARERGIGTDTICTHGVTVTPVRASDELHPF